MKRYGAYLRLAARSARFYRRTNVGVLLGVAIAGGVLTGALLVGDSVRFSLRRFALLRLGNSDCALHTENRFFRETLAGTVDAELPDAYVIPALRLRGVAIRPENADRAKAQVNQVQVLGVRADFQLLAGAGSFALADNEIALGSKLARQLAVAPGDDIALRVEKPGILPRDAPLSSMKGGLSKRGVFTVKRIVADSELGRFSLTADQVVPHNAFVSLAWLQTRVELDGRANMLLVGRRVGRKPGNTSLAARANHALAVGATLSHLGITLRNFPEYGLSQLESDRVFFSAATAQAALLPDTHTEAVGILTYLVNSLSCRTEQGVRSTPYSFVTASSRTDLRNLALTPTAMRDDQILINRWLADELQAGPGDEITLSYYELTKNNEFVEQSRRFEVLSVLDMHTLQTERALFPTFPGLTDVDTCKDWDVGMPMVEERLYDKPNQQYWTTYRETPKAVVTLDAGRAMWANRFGNLSAVRYPLHPAHTDALRKAIRDGINPGQLGLVFQPVRDQALKAVSASMDFGHLFLGMSFFLLGAALMLTSLLFVFGIQQRAAEMGTLLAVGFRKGEVRRLFLWENGIIAALGAILGTALGTLYARILIWSVRTHWAAVVGGSVVEYHANLKTLALGTLATFSCGLLTIVTSMRAQSRRSAGELLQADVSQDTPRRHRNISGPAFELWAPFLALGAALALTAWGLTGTQDKAVGVFFGAGTLMLTGGLGLVRFWLGTRAGQFPMLRLGVDALGIRNAARRRGRSLTVCGLLACGCFMVFSVFAMKKDVRANAGKRWSGTGGFEFFGLTTIGVPHDPTTSAGRTAFGLTDAALKTVDILPIKVRDGDDASCLNLNRAQTPRLLGIDPAAFRERAAFVPAQGGDGPWMLLEQKPSDGSIPALAGDMHTALWGLKKKVGPEQGDVFSYLDEAGNRMSIKLVGTLPMPLSIFQGSLLIAEQTFNRRFPSESGYRMFLFDVPGNNPNSARTALSAAFDKVGMDLTTTTDRLLEFYGMEATYLAMFLVLGGLGIVLGTVGVGIVVLRNVLERRNEFALLRCLGFTGRQVIRVIVAEHWALLLLGLVIGGTSAAVAIWPNLKASGVRIPLGTVGALLGAILLMGLVSTVVAARAALRRPLIEALRNE